MSAADDRTTSGVSDVRMTTLGRTGLRVSVAGLGCGGASRLGLRTGKDEAHAAGLVRRAFDLGVNFIDTAASYGTEPAVGRALAELPRDEVVLSTKVSLHAGKDRPEPTVAQVVETVERSLNQLRTDRVEVLHLHALTVGQWVRARDEVIPAIAKLVEQGKVRHLAASEMFHGDRGHAMLTEVLPADVFDVVMVGFNILNPSARERVFPITMERGVATLIMFAVRRALSDPERLREIVGELIEAGAVDADTIDADDPLGFVTDAPGAGSLAEAAYRFCAHEPGADVVLFGTGDPNHLEHNVRAINMPALPDEVHARLTRLFGRVDSVSGQ